ARALNESGVDGVAEIYGIESATRIHIEHGRKTRFQIGLRISQRNECTLRRRITARVDMHVCVDHSRQHGGHREIDNSSLRGNTHRRSHVRNSIAPNEDDLVAQDVSGFGIEQSPCPDGYHLSRWGKESAALCSTGFL